MIFDSETIEKLIQRPKPHYQFPVWEDVQGKVIMVTGAGGFIGSHLCRELQKHKPAMIVLVEWCEFSLYEVHRSLTGVPVVPILGSYGDFYLMADVLQSFNVSMVFHVGAYKHVPLVERNMLGALDNNVLSAKSLVTACEHAKVKQMVVVSSDKAVRPTNVMGATKRMVEQVALASQIPDVKVVRFGNVLWSTGSVLPLFYEQLTKHKRVTLTDLEVDRYFMSVQQAVCLILQSIALADRGIYVFDMGEPVKIKSLVEQLAQELKIKEFKIDVVGLRPGEKLHEELTLGDGLQPTTHNEILLAHEEVMTRRALGRALSDIEQAVVQRDVGKARQVLQQYVPGYEPMCGIVDDLFLHKYVVTKAKELDDCFKVPVLDENP